MFIYSILTKSYSKLTNTKTLSYIIFFSSLLFIFTKASVAEFQKYHYLTLFFISSFYWILVNFKNRFLISFSSPFLLVLAALILDKYHNAFFAGLLFLFYYLLFEKKNFKNFIYLANFSLICLLFVSLSLFYNYVFAGQLDAWLWELPLNLKNNIVSSAYFDENLLKFWTWEYNEYRSFEHQPLKNWFGWFDVFNLPILIIWYAWGILVLLILCYQPSRKLFFAKSHKNYRYINFLLPLTFFTFIILLAYLSSVSFNVTSIRRALQVFSTFFAYLSFIITILFVIEFIVKSNFLNLKKYIQGFALMILTLVFLASLIKFDRTSNYKTGLPDNSFKNVRQIKYFFGKIGIKETVDQGLSFELCKQVDNLFNSKTKILMLSNIGKDCRLPTKNIKIFKANYNNIKTHLFDDSKNSFNLLKKNNYEYFVFFFDFKKNYNFFVMDDLSIYYKAFDLDFLLNRFNLASATSATFNELDQDRKSETNTHFPNELIKKVFDIDQIEPTVLIEHDNNYFIIELTKTENIQRKVTDQSVKKEILLNLKKQTKRKLISEIISKINKNNFKKNDFDKLSKDEKVAIKRIRLENRNDDNVLKQELINQIYAFSEKKVIVVADIGFSENFLIYIDKIENVSIGEKTENYKKYFDLSKNKITTDLYNTYNSYLENKYKININHQTLAKTKNYF